MNRMENEEIRLMMGKAGEQGIALSRQQAESLISYYHLMVEKNKVMNLTRITDFADVVEKHFIDSLMAVRVMDLALVKKVMDLGSGAGFPGIPLKIAFPQIELTMIDSVAKKMQFVREASREIGLEDCEALHVRAEDLARNADYRERFDLCVSRAVANLSTLTEYCLPFVRVGGSFLAYKAGGCSEEVEQAGEAIRRLGGDIKEVAEFDLYGMGRAVIRIDKMKKSPAQYPRKAGIPARNPL